MPHNSPEEYKKISFLIILSSIIIGIGISFYGLASLKTNQVDTKGENAPRFPTTIKPAQNISRNRIISPVEAKKEAYPETLLQGLDINNAGPDKLEELPGIGPVTALKIIRYREQNGPFGSIEDIQKVSGIGPCTFNDIKSLICVEENARDSADSGSSGININTAGAKELSALPGIGEKTALNIISYREEHGPFQSGEDILKVDGIGAKKLGKFDHMITFGGYKPAPSAATEPEPSKININRATAEELAMLPGFSNNLAERIIRYRRLNGPFASAEKIADVPGISYMTFFKIQDFITIE
ncbi:MAG: ComEA family DNA-binding protein [Candidatus Aureabacteria bacterium]|nr:ComEA family DNA-binding protein [Candidatus Auribacterota bacterium]